VELGNELTFRLPRFRSLKSKLPPVSGMNCDIYDANLYLSGLTNDMPELREYCWCASGRKSLLDSPPSPKAERPHCMADLQ